MRLKPFLLALCLLVASQVSAFSLKDVIYKASDAKKVESLLRQGRNISSEDGKDVLFFARTFIGVPYVAGTLEISDPERLVVNLRQMDCTTFSETVVALVQTKRQGGTTFGDFCHNLRRMRYRGGIMSGYVSRLHYFSDWIGENSRRGLVKEAAIPVKFRSSRKVNVYYMSRNYKKYKMLAKHPSWVGYIRASEKRLNGRTITYYPLSAFLKGTANLKGIKNGMLLAIVTSKAGLDYSHLGFAAWGRDGKLHLLNASSVYKRVVEDKQSLGTYLSKQRTALGVKPLMVMK